MFHLYNFLLCACMQDQRAKIRERLGIPKDAPIDPKYERMSMSCDGCGPFSLRVDAMINAGMHIPLCIHWLKLVAGGTGLKSSGQENDRSPVFPHLKKEFHTCDRRYCELFLKKDPLAPTDTDVLTKARFILATHCTHAHTHTHTCTYAHAHTISLTHYSLTNKLTQHIQVFLGTISIGEPCGSQQIQKIHFGCKPRI